MRRKHDGLSIFAPYYERINNQYDIERVLLEFHIEVQKKPEFFKECIGVFPLKNGNVTFRKCFYVPIPCIGSNVGRWRCSSGRDDRPPVCWSYFDYPDMYFEVMEGE